MSDIEAIAVSLSRSFLGNGFRSVLHEAGSGAL
jgi:hypothetical protein